MKLNPLKLLPLAIGGLLALGVVGWWVNEIIQRSLMAEGSSYSAPSYTGKSEIRSKSTSYDQVRK